METRVASLGVGVHRKRLKKQNQKKKHSSRKLFTVSSQIITCLLPWFVLLNPLISHLQTDFLVSTSPAGVDTRKPREETPKKLLEKAVVCLTSDYCVYAPLHYLGKGSLKRSEGVWLLSEMFPLVPLRDSVVNLSK